MSAAARREAFLFTEQTERRACPVCHAKLDAATGVSMDASDRRPTMKIGDLTVCVYCGGVLTLTTIGFRVATDAEVARVDHPLRDLILSFPTRRSRPS
jgi:hypothetical protein